MEQHKFDNELTDFLAKNNIVIKAENASTMSQDDFKKIRYDGFGASDSSRILDVNPFPGGSPEDLLKDKIFRVHDDSIGKKSSVRMGRDLEDFIINKVSSILGTEIYKPAHMYGKEFNGLNTNFDGVMIDGQYIPAEIKVISPYGLRYYNFDRGIALETEDGPIENALEKIRSKYVEMSYASETYKTELTPMQRHINFNAELVGIPTYYYTQLQQQIDFLDAPYGYLFALDSKNWIIYCFKAEKDHHTISTLNGRAKKLFERLMEAREMEK